MNVLYDGVAFENSYQRGIQRAYRELIGHLPAGVDAVLTLTEKTKAELPARGRVVSLGMPGVGLLPRRLRRAIQPTLSGPRRRKMERWCGVFESTYYTLPEGRVPTVVRVHDLIPERHGRFFEAAWAAREIARRRTAIERADRIIAISAATARELEHFHPTSKGKTTVVHWGHGHLPRVGPMPGKDPAYALYVGDRAGYKNFGVVLSAVESSAWPRSVGLAVVGPRWTQEEERRVASPALRGVVRHHGRVHDEELARLYAEASCAIASSIDEGFGFPLLEGQGAGVPVVCSDIAVFREVAGEAGALFFDPVDPGSLAERVKAGLASDVRAGLVSVGTANLKRFSWDSCARASVEVYKMAATSAENR